MANKIFNDLKLIVYDFDGVMTDNRVYVDQNGNESVQVNRSDGLGVSEIKKLGIEQIIISTEKNPVVTKRAKKLNIKCLQGIDNKKQALEEYCYKKNIKLQNTAFVGNDINDLEALEIAGYSFCPADAHKSVKDISIYTLKSNGGEGVIREIFDLINMENK